MAVVLDTTNLAGAYGARLFAEAGHDVIRVEPSEGDDIRRMGPTLGTNADLEHGAFHEFLNAGKRSLSLNLQTVVGKKVFLRLIERADVLLSSFPLPVEEEVIRQANSQLVLVQVDDEGVPELCAYARSGLLSITGQPDKPPMVLGYHIVYNLVGLYMSVAASAGLYQRSFSGSGHSTTVSVRECMEGMLEQAMTEYAFAGKGTERRGTKGGITAVSGAVPSKDGFWCVSISGGPEVWERFMEWVDDPELSDESLSDEPGRQKKRDFIIERVYDWSRRQTKEELVEKAQDLHIASSPVATTQDLKDDPQLIERGYLSQMEHPRYGRVLFPRGAIANVLDKPPMAAPTLGQHNSEILAELGYSPADREVLLASKAM